MSDFSTDGVVARLWYGACVLLLAGVLSVEPALAEIGRENAAPPAGNSTQADVSAELAAIGNDQSRLGAFCWLMNELGKLPSVVGDERAAVYASRMAELGPAIERGFDADPASPEGVAFEEGMAALYERCDK